jgi:hypothetical protein
MSYTMLVLIVAGLGSCTLLAVVVAVILVGLFMTRPRQPVADKALS